MSVIVLFALALVAVALLCAGVYGLFGKPSTHDGKERKRHVVHGFQLGGGILLGIILMGSLVGGSQIAFGIVESARLSRIGAFFVAAAALAITFSMVEHWAKHFAGWVGYAAMRNGLFMLTSGHAVNNSSVFVPRWWSVSAMALFIASALVCVRFTKKYVLNAADKAALIVWLLAFTCAVDVESTHATYREQFALASMLAGTVALVAAWSHHRNTHHHHHAAVEAIRSSAQQSGS